MINYNELQLHIEEALKKSIQTLKTGHYYGDIYIFALYIDYEYKKMGITFNTQLHLNQCISEEEDTDYHLMYKLNHTDWYYASLGKIDQLELSENFYIINKILSYNDCINRMDLYEACKHAISSIRDSNLVDKKQPFMILSEDREKYLFNDILSLEYSAMINSNEINMEYQQLFDQFDLSVFDYNSLQLNLENAIKNALEKLRSLDFYNEIHIFALSTKVNCDSLNLYYNTKSHIEQDLQKSNVNSYYNTEKWFHTTQSIKLPEFEIINNYLTEHANVIECRVFYQTCIDAVNALKSRKLFSREIPFLLLSENPNEATRNLLRSFNAKMNHIVFMKEFLERY